MQSLLGISHSDTLNLIDDIADIFMQENKFSLVTEMYQEYIKSADLSLSSKNQMIFRHNLPELMNQNNKSKTLLTSHSGTLLYHEDDCMCGRGMCRESYNWTCCDERRIRTYCKKSSN